MMQKPLLSVVIPTHNRSQYALSTIKSLIALSSDIQIVVCDTSSDDVISTEFLNESNRGRLNIIRPPNNLSVVDNFNEALKYAKGHYVIFIGDDDFVTASVVEIAKWAKDNDVDAIRCTFPASYYWPDYYSQYFKDGYAAKLAVRSFTGSIKSLNSKEAYLTALDSLGGGVGEMPRAYLGLISMNLISAIEKKFGKLFGGVSPDIYSAALISNTASKVVDIDYPFIIPGHSGVSTSGQSASGGHRGKLRDNDHIRPFVDLKWDVLIPEYYSVPTVWGYSLFKAVEKTGIGSPNLERLYVKCMLYNTRYWPYTIKSIAARMHNSGVLRVVYKIILSFIIEIRIQLARILNRIKKPSATGQSDTVFKSITDTEQASITLDAYLKSKPIIWKRFND